MDTLLLFVLLIALSGFFSGIEIAYFSLSSGKIRTMVRHGYRGAKLVEYLKDRPRKLLISILICNNLVNIFAAAVATELAINMFGSRGVGIATGVVTLLILIFGEVFPKTIAQFNAEKISRYVSPVIFIIMKVLSPIIWIFEKMMDLVSFSRTKKPEDINAKITEEEIRSLFQLGVEKGTIEKHEKEFAERLFRFNDVPISLIMKPLNKAIMLDGDAPINSVLDYAGHSGYSRFPVYKGRKKEIIGIVHIKDIVKAVSSKQKSKTVSSIAKRPFFVYENEKLDDIFKKITKGHTHYILIRNKKNKIIGLATLEDIIEELVGEIYDESDKRKKGSIT